MPTKLLTLIALPFLAVSLTAQIQNYIHPKGYETHEGPEATAIPFGISDTTKANRQFRYMQIHDSVLPKSVGLRSFAIRRDGPTRFDYMMCWVEMSLIMSTSKNSAARASATFANNHGKDAVTMMERSRVYFFPSLSKGKLPEDMDFPLPCG